MYYTKYKINKDFFKNWNDNMAYILGVIAADGCIQDRQFRIGVSDKDVIWLHKIKDIMESTHPIYYRKSDNISLLCRFKRNGNRYKKIWNFRSKI